MKRIELCIEPVGYRQYLLARHGAYYPKKSTSLAKASAKGTRILQGEQKGKGKLIRIWLIGEYDDS